MLERAVTAEDHQRLADDLRVTVGERRGIDVECAESGDEVGQRNKGADLLVLAARGFLKRRGGRIGVHPGCAGERRFSLRRGHIGNRE